MTAISQSQTSFYETPSYFQQEVGGTIQFPYSDKQEEQSIRDDQNIKIVVRNFNSDTSVRSTSNVSSAGYIQTMKNVYALPKIVICTLVVSVFFALLGLLSLIFFLSNGVYIIHPYMAVMSFIGGSFLFSSSVLAIKGE